MPLMHRRTTLPVLDRSVDAVLGAHTVYFWPDPPATLTEDQALDWLRAAGFTDIEVHKRPAIAEAVIWLTAATSSD